MNRLRNRSYLVWLTLLAFGVQLAVAATHHHARSETGMAARAMTAGICGPSAKVPCAPSKETDGCVLCWASAVAATSLTPPSAPEVPLPPSFVAATLAVPDGVVASTLRRDAFQARGPPHPSAA